MADKDRRLYARITLDFPADPKIKPLSSDAFRTLIEAICWSRQHLTDGFLATRLALANWSLENLRELCDNDTENPSLFEVEGGYQIHDFALHQDTKADIEARRERAVSAGQLGGLARAKRTAKRTASKSLSKMPSKTQAETETETETDTTTYVSPNGDTPVVVARATGAPAQGPPGPPPKFCPDHPDGTDRPCRGCESHRKVFEQWDQTRRREQDEVIRRCKLCDNNGSYGLRLGSIIRCPHDEALIRKWEDKLAAEEKARHR